MTSVFTKVLSGELPGRFVFRDDRCAVFLTIAPIAPGHLLVIPRTHVRDASESPHIAGLTMARAAEIARPPFNIITSAGREATQSVWHLHLHIVPRREDDGLALPWWSGRRTRAGGRP